MNDKNEYGGTVNASSGEKQMGDTSGLKTLKRFRPQPHWYALRATYGREKKAYDYMVCQGRTAFYPTIKRMKLVDGKKRSVEESRIPNLLFVYGLEAEIRHLLGENADLSFLRFYCGHSHVGTRTVTSPLVIPDAQIESLKIICDSENEDILFVPDDVSKFREGQLVRVVHGAFEGGDRPCSPLPWTAAGGRGGRWFVFDGDGLCAECLSGKAVSRIPLRYSQQFNLKNQGGAAGNAGL